MRPWLFALVLLGGCDGILGLTVQPAPVDAQGDTILPCPGDRFEASTIDMTRWNVFSDSGTSLSQANGLLDIDLPASTPNAYAGLMMIAPLPAAMTTQVELVQPVTEPTSEAVFALTYSGGGRIMFSQGSGTLAVYVNSIEQIYRQFDALRDRFLRIEYAGPDLVLSTSPDNQIWITLFTTPAPASPPAVEILAGVYESTAAPGHVAFDNFEIVTPDCQP
jgi:hypothetical protein